MISIYLLLDALQDGLEPNPPHRGDIDDAPFLAVDHIGQDELAAMERPFDIDIKHIVPFVFRNIGKKLLLGNTAVIHQDVDCPELCERLGNHAAYLYPVGDIRLNEDSVTGIILQFMEEIVSGIYGTQIINNDIIPFPGKTESGSTADSPGSAGN